MMFLRAKNKTKEIRKDLVDTFITKPIHFEAANDVATSWNERFTISQQMEAVDQLKRKLVQISEAQFSEMSTHFD